MFNVATVGNMSLSYCVVFADRSSMPKAISWYYNILMTEIVNLTYKLNMFALISLWKQFEVKKHLNINFTHANENVWGYNTNNIKLSKIFWFGIINYFA